MNDIPTHLLSSLGILSSFSIAKRISKEDVSKISKKIKRVYKEKNKKKFEKLLLDALLENAKKYVMSEVPPGLIFPDKNMKKERLDRLYTELSIISQTLSNKFIEQKLTKHEICFIINAIINLTGVNERDFDDFYKKFSKYKNNDFSEDGERDV